jgi:hypothetical protein
MDTHPKKPHSEKDASEIGKTARQTGEQASEEVKGRAESMKAEASERVSETASALNAAADTLEGEGQERIAEALSNIAHNLGEFASQLEHKSVDQLLQDGGRLAQRNPLLFVAGSVGAGVLLSRFFRARARPGGHGRYGVRYGLDDERGRYGMDDERVRGFGDTTEEASPRTGVETTHPEASSSAVPGSQGGSRPGQMNEPYKPPQAGKPGGSPSSPSKHGGER